MTPELLRNPPYYILTIAFLAGLGTGLLAGLLVGNLIARLCAP